MVKQKWALYLEPCQKWSLSYCLPTLKQWLYCVNMPHALLRSSEKYCMDITRGMKLPEQIVVIRTRQIFLLFSCGQRKRSCCLPVKIQISYIIHQHGRMTARAMVTRPTWHEPWKRWAVFLPFYDKTICLQTKKIKSCLQKSAVTPGKNA